MFKNEKYNKLIRRRRYYKFRSTRFIVFSILFLTMIFIPTRHISDLSND